MVQLADVKMGRVEVGGSRSVVQLANVEIGREGGKRE